MNVRLLEVWAKQSMKWILNLAGSVTWHVSDKLLESRLSRRLFSRRTLSAMRHDLLRLRARVLHKSECDVVHSDYDVALEPSAGLDFGD